MAKWVRKNIDSFKRDILRDFCLATSGLEEQFERFDNSGVLSFAVMHGLIGNMMAKGPLWRLKDTSHHLMGSSAIDYSAVNFDIMASHCLQNCLGQSSVEAWQENIGGILDWTIGYVFHECIKITEDAYQLQYYGPRLLPMSGNKTHNERQNKEKADIISVMREVISQSHISLERESFRVKFLLEQARRLFCLYLEGESKNFPLARFLHDSEDLVRSCFHDYYESLLQAVYGNDPELMYIQAGYSLIESGHSIKAMEAAKKAARLKPDSLPVQEIIRKINTLLEHFNFEMP